MYPYVLITISGSVTFVFGGESSYSLYSVNSVSNYIYLIFYIIKAFFNLHQRLHLLLCLCDEMILHTTLDCAYYNKRETNHKYELPKIYLLVLYLLWICMKYNKCSSIFLILISPCKQLIKKCIWILSHCNTVSIFIQPHLWHNYILNVFLS